MKIFLSQKALDICKANYDKNCGNCGLRPLCCGPWTKGVEEATIAINELAETIS